MRGRARLERALIQQSFAATFNNYYANIGPAVAWSAGPIPAPLTTKVF